MKLRMQALVGICGMAALIIFVLAAPQSALAALTFQSTGVTTSGALTIDGVAGSAYLFGPSTTTGSIVIGGTAQTGSITLGSSTAANSVLIGNGSGATAIVLGAGNASSDVGIGTATINNRLTVAGSADFSGTLGLDGTAVNPYDVVNINYTGAPTQGLTGVYSNLTLSTAHTVIAGDFESTSTEVGNSSSLVWGILVRSSDDSSGGGVALTTEGADIQASTGSGSVTNSDASINSVITHGGYTNTLYGGDFQVNDQGSTPVSYVVNAALNDTSTSGLGTASLLRGAATNTSSATVSSLRGLDLSSWSSTGTITNSYGIYMDNTIGVGTTSYALYSAATAQSYLQGNLGIGIAVPTAKLQVKDGHFGSVQTTAPTASVTGSGYSGASVSGTSTDTKGTVTATVGAATGTLVVTFNISYAAAPVCTVSAANAAAQVDAAKYYVTTGTGALTLNFPASPTGGSESWNYICVQ